MQTQERFPVQWSGVLWSSVPAEEVPHRYILHPIIWSKEWINRILKTPGGTCWCVMCIVLHRACGHWGEDSGSQALLPDALQASCVWWGKLEKTPWGTPRDSYLSRLRCIFFITCEANFKSMSPGHFVRNTMAVSRSGSKPSLRGGSYREETCSSRWRTRTPTSTGSPTTLRYNYSSAVGGAKLLSLKYY